MHSFNSIRFDNASIHSDNAVFYLMGKAILDGKVLYKDIFDHKTPYIYFINALASMFDKNHVGLFIITSIVLFISLYFTYKIVRLFIDNLYLALLASTFISLFLNNANITLGFLRTEGYAIALLLPSAYLFLKFFLSDAKRFKLSHIYLIGILAGLNLFINVKASILYVPFAISVFVVLINYKNIKNIVLCFVFGLAGVVVASLPAIIYVVNNNCINEAVDAIFRINSIYSYYDSSVNSFHESKLETILTVARMHPILTSIIVIELLCIALYKTKKSIKLPTLFSFLLCLSYTIFVNRPYTYYYTIIIPYLIPVCLLVIRKVECLNSKLITSGSKVTVTGNDNTTHFPKWIVVILFLGIFILNFYIGFFVVNRRYENNVDTRKILNDMLEKEIDINDETKILSFGFSPEYYMFLNEKLSYKYFIIPNIKFEYYDTPYLEQINYIKKALPDVLIFSFGDYTTQLPKRYFDEFKNAVNSNYKYLGDMLIYTNTDVNPKVLVRKQN